MNRKEEKEKEEEEKEWDGTRREKRVKKKSEQEIAEEKPYLQQVQSVVRWKGHSSFRLLLQSRSSSFRFLNRKVFDERPKASAHLWRKRAAVHRRVIISRCSV